MSEIKLNGARLSIINSRFEGICRKMANTLLRTGRSGVLNRARDFSCCIVNRHCELLSAADCLPIHVLSGPDLMVRSMLEFHKKLYPGDAFLHNSPYHGCSHPADHTILMPVIDEAGLHRFTVVAKAHQADIGNATPTTYSAAARDVYEEGALIFPAVKVQDRGALVEDVVRMCQMRIRVPDQWHGDFLAMLGAARIGVQEIERLASDLRWEKLEAFSQQWLDYSEDRMERAIRGLRGGAGTATAVHDPMQGTPPNGIHVNASVRIDPAEGRISVDLRDNIDALPCGLNLSEACSRTAALAGVFNSIGQSIPRNGGSFRRIDILLKENSVAGIPRHPTSCSMATTNVADRLTAAVQLAFSQTSDGLGMAEVGPNLPACKAVIFGWDPRFKRNFVNQMFLGATGGAATAWNDAWLTYGHVGNGGMGFIDSVEQDELIYPLEIVERRLLADTEGAGTHIGAGSLRVEYRATCGSLTATYSADGAVNLPQGVWGGGSPGGAAQFRRGLDGTISELPASASINLTPGESIIAITPGGGGFGDPLAPRSGSCRKCGEGWPAQWTSSTDHLRSWRGCATDRRR
jgi:N-methylhydantoinase B